MQNSFVCDNKLLLMVKDNLFPFFFGTLVYDEGPMWSILLPRY